MIKTLQQALKMDREKFKVPRSVQQAIPIQRIWPDGVFQSGTKFSKTFRFSDINYAIASKEDKTEMFLDYSELGEMKKQLGVMQESKVKLFAVNTIQKVEHQVQTLRFQVGE